MFFPALRYVPFVCELQMCYLAFEMCFIADNEQPSNRHAPVCLLVFVHTYLGPALLSNVAISLHLRRYRSWCLRALATYGVSGVCLRCWAGVVTRSFGGPVKIKTRC